MNDITLYCDVGSQAHKSLVGKFKERGLEITVEDSGREVPVVQQGKNFYSGIREIFLRYFPSKRNQ